MTLHKVLIPTNGTAFAKQIFPFVTKFLPPEANALILLRVGDPPEGHVGHPARLAAPDSPVEMFETARDVEETIHPIFASQERQALEGEFHREMLDDIHRLERAGYSVTAQVRFGEPGEQIVAFAEANDVDLVAMTTHWRRGVNRLIFGSVAQHVAHHLAIPMMMVRAREPE